MHIITANRLTDGEVVWLAANGNWVETVDAAETFHDEDALAVGLARGQAAVEVRLVVDAYEIAVEHSEGRVVPVRFRERIRALGPTVRTDLGKQARTRQSAA